jgi:hypothetical protein
MFYKDSIYAISSLRWGKEKASITISSLKLIFFGVTETFYAL